MTSPLPPLSAAGPQGTSPAPVPTAPRQRSAQENSAAAFEAVFIGQMVQLMFDNLPADGEWSGGHGETMFRGMLAEQMGRAMSARGGLGLAPMVMAQMQRMEGQGAEQGAEQGAGLARGARQ